MELLGGVSAAFGLAQTGFSLAKAIRETAKDYKDARDDIVGLARVIESTLSRVAEVEGLIKDNDKTKVFSDNGLITIKNSFLDLERIVRDLIALLTTAGVPRDTYRTIRPEDVAVTRFQKVGWVGLKSEVKDKKDELSNIQIDLTLAIICAQARSAVSPTVVAALRIRVADLEMERRQYASKGIVPGKPDVVHSSTNDSNSHSVAPVPDVSREPPALSPTSSGQSAILIPGGDGGILLGGDIKPGSTDHVPLDNGQKDNLQQDASPTGQQQDNDTDKLPQEGTQQQLPEKNEATAQHHALDVPNTARYAHLLVVDGVEMFVTPLLPPKHPKRLSRSKPQVTAQVWAAFSPNLRKEIAASLESMFPLPRGLGWHLAFARDTATPSKWKRILARALHLYENHDPQQSSRDGNHCYMVLFVSSRMFNNEATSERRPPQAPVHIQNYIHTQEDTVSTVYSGSTPQVRTLIEQRSDDHERRERIPVVMPVPRRERSDSSWTDGQRRRSRARRDSSSASDGTNGSRVRRHDRERLERGRREFVEEARKLRKEIEIRNRANRSATEGRHRDREDGERRRMEREYMMEEYSSERHATRHKTLEEEKRSLEILERRKRDEMEEERRVLEDLKRREFAARERERELQHRAKVQEMKAEETADHPAIVAEQQSSTSARRTQSPIAVANPEDIPATARPHGSQGSRPKQGGRKRSSDLTRDRSSRMRKKEAEKQLGIAPQHRIVEADLSPSEIEEVTIPVTKDRKQRRTSNKPERTTEEETQLFNDAMLRFTGRML